MLASSTHDYQAQRKTVRARINVLSKSRRNGIRAIAPGKRAE